MKVEMPEFQSCQKRRNIMAKTFNDVVEYVENELNVPSEFVAQVLRDRGFDEEEELDVFEAMEAVRYAIDGRALLFAEE